MNKGFDCRSQKTTLVLPRVKLEREPTLLVSPLGMNGGFAQPSSRPTSAEKTFACVTRSPLKGKGKCSPGGSRGGLAITKAALFLRWKTRDHLRREPRTRHSSVLCFFFKSSSTSSFRIRSAASPRRPKPMKNPPAPGQVLPQSNRVHNLFNLIKAMKTTASCSMLNQSSVPRAAGDSTASPVIQGQLASA